MTALVLSAAVLVAGCSGGAPRVDGAGRTPAAGSAATPEYFARLGSRFIVPTGWSAREGSIDWEAGPAHKGLPDVDTFAARDGDPWLVLQNRRLTGHPALSAWIAELTARGDITYPQCAAPQHLGTVTLGGEQAQTRAFHCPVDGPNALAVQVLTTHNGIGWVALCYSESGETGPIPAAERQCSRWLQGFSFAD